MRPHNQFNLLLACQFLVTFAMMVLIPVMPLYLNTLVDTASASSNWSAIAIAAPAVGALISAPILGRLCDQMGYKQVLCLSLLLFIISLFTMALSSEVVMFIAARLLLGLAGTGVVLTVFFSQAPYFSRAQQLAKQQSAIALACLLGPLFGGISLDTVGMNSLLLITSIVSALCLISCLLGFKPQDLKHSQISQYTTKRLLRSTALGRWLVAGACSQAGAFALVIGFAIYLSELWQYTHIATWIGILHALAWLATFITAKFWGQRNEQHCPQQSFVIGCIGSALAVLLIVLAPSLWVIALLRFCQGACFSALPQTLFLQVGKLAPNHHQGTVIAKAKSAQVFGQLMGPFLVTLCYAQFGVDSIPWLVAGLFTAGALALLVPLPTVYFLKIKENSK